MTKPLITCVAFLLFFFSGLANNLQIGAVTVSNVSGTQYLNFSISWENSWRMNSGPNNRDAVWIFVKRRDCAGLQWHHVNLSANDADHSANSLLFVDAYADKKGVMLYRSAAGSGNISNISIQLKMDSVPAGSYEYKVFGIEMVYVPQGAFYAGDGSSYSSLERWPDNQPYLISSEDTIAIGQDTGKLYNINSPLYDNGLTGGTTLASSYPKGYNAFYIMKYEISQGQYADFLNNITQDAATNRRYPGGPVVNRRFSIQGSWPQISSTTPDRACNFLSFQDLAALLDWAALSPMTELEFEKACRGLNLPVAGEMAWGGNAATDANNVAVGTDGTAAEYITDSILTGTGLANFSTADTFYGPLRCGFAARPGTNRFQSGATYYGAMEMSGNLMEQCYNLAIFNTGAVGGGTFAGGHGDGELTSTPHAGYANAGWPKEIYEIPFQEGYAVARKGGSTIYTQERLAVSDRNFVILAGATLTELRREDCGGRGVSRR